MAEGTRRSSTTMTLNARRKYPVPEADPSIYYAISIHLCFHFLYYTSD